ncbi:hypothetical protein ASPVEDRAFT_58421 [Aspergillus versicolor CBS 583.65]|uniref:Uncharacterized protein n=1 Tax=Aspergillus versicolor CBS 583.65 TaxID=1036611 RepID=A0A1L9P4M5_ASPVE|nr:uncharacterized protein ASPVEDRAFT_58421 [Aspergillus versicolor CBS 583.65]OJI96452.1 hypothetical protein ASPVEDRAFT_58421 [Aspergillus versicolor CBS 583.65]
MPVYPNHIFLLASHSRQGSCFQLVPLSSDTKKRDVSSPPESGPPAAVDSPYSEGSIATSPTPRSLPDSMFCANPTQQDTWSSKPATASICSRSQGSQTPRCGSPGGAARKRGGRSN